LLPFSIKIFIMHVIKRSSVFFIFSSYLIKIVVIVIRQYAYVYRSATIFNIELRLQHNIFITKHLFTDTWKTPKYAPLCQLAISLVVSYYSLWSREYEPLVSTKIEQIKQTWHFFNYMISDICKIFPCSTTYDNRQRLQLENTQ
jgi:hypothetical protein